MPGRDFIANTVGCTPYSFGTRPAFVRAAGAHLFDVTGRQYLDMANCFGSVFLGHGDPRVERAVEQAMRSALPSGSNFDLPERVAATLQRDHAPGSAVAFFRTGTDAVRAAAAAVRRTTGKRLLLSAGYHGWDPMWDEPAPGRVNDEGVAHFYYSVPLLDHFLALHADEVAAAVIAPDFVHVDGKFAADLFSRLADLGVPTVADEVKYGYRFGAGTSIPLAGATADIHVYSKTLANGWPLAALVGDAALLDALQNASSTLTYGLAPFAAADACLATLAEQDVARSVAHHGDRFLRGAGELLAGSELPIGITGTGTAFQFVAAEDVEHSFLTAALDAGMLLEQHDQQLPSWSFRDEVVDEALERLQAALDAVKRSRPDLVGTEVGPDAAIQAAWHQMDGLPDVDWALDETLAWLDARLARREPGR